MKSVNFNKKLALGTAQFGLDYGIANQKGKIGSGVAADILEYAQSSGIDTLDTAIAYGDSEQCLGEIGVSSWNVVSKLPEIPVGTTNIDYWVKQSVDNSLQRLKISQLYGLLLHRPQQLLSPEGQAIYQSLNLIKAQGLVDKIGISIYNQTEIETLFNEFSWDLIQAPFNVLDRTLESSGWLSRLKGLGVEIHVRSVFLQGLLLMNPLTRPTYFQRWQSLWQRWENWLADNSLTPLQGCLGCVISNPEIDRVVVGVDSLIQLQEIIATTTEKLLILPDDLCSDDSDLINPARWKLR
ncbi:MAG: aldo/keto reductase [Oscillatoria sp. SIO1A7]|nr:aldo/keto reductase [Oscillatoria sp. SIO1A7]